MYYLFPTGDTFSIFCIRPDLPNLIELESLPTGDGILKRREDGTFYYEPFPEVEPPTEPELPVEPEQPKPELTLEAMQAKILLNTEMLLLQKEIGK